MNSPGAGQSQARSRWSDSTLSTAFEVPVSQDASSSQQSNRDDAESFVSPGLKRRAPTDGSGEIPIMFQSEDRSLVASKSLPQLARPDANVVPAIVRTGTTSETLFPQPLRLRSRHFSPSDGALSKTLISSPSMLPPPIPPSAHVGPPKSQHSRARSESRTLNPAPVVPPLPNLRARSEFYPRRLLPLLPRDMEVPFESHPRSTLSSPSPPTKPSTALRARSSNPLGLTLEQPLPSPSRRVGSLRSRSHSASNLRTPTTATMLLQPVSPLTPRSPATPHASQSNAPHPRSHSRTMSSLASASPAGTAFSSPPRRPSSHQPGGKMIDFYTTDEAPPPLFSSSTGANAPSTPSHLKKSRLDDVLPPVPNPTSPSQAHDSTPQLRTASRASSRSSKGSLLARALQHFQPHESRGYNVIDESQEDYIALRDVRKSMQSSHLSSEQVAVDLSTMAGDQEPTGFDSANLGRGDLLKRRTSNDNILEAKGHLTGGLGSGMNAVITKALVVDESARVVVGSPKSFGWRKHSGSFGQAWVGQATAEFEGAVVAVDEQQGFDISNAEGRLNFGGLDTEASPIAADTAKQSYYFPPDPLMPDWRPFTMRQWYMILLIALALIFAAVTEALCQISSQRQAETPPASLLTFQDPEQVSTGDWFVWKYLPEIILVSYGVMFQATDFQVRRLEPYYQMSQPTGARAEQSLNMDYLTFGSFFIPFKAYHHRQWAVLESSVATLIATGLVPVLFSAALKMDPDRSLRTPTSWKYVRMDPVWSRLMEVALLVVAIIAILLLVQLRRKSGLLSDPKGVAGAAAMATKSHILNDFRGLEMASHRTIHKHLEHRRYILHKSSLWQGEYLTSSSTEANTVLPRTENPHPIALRVYSGCIFACLLVFFVVFIPIVEFDQSVNIITDRAPWFLTLLATSIKISWTNLETGVRLLEPFYVLSRRHAPANTLLLDYTGTIPGYMPVKAALHGHFLLAAVGISSVLCEVLTVVASSFNINGKAVATGVGAGFGGGSETKSSYITSFVLAMAIPVVLISVLTAVFLRRRHAFLPRQPNTIASVLAFVAQSKMLYDFVIVDDDASSTGSHQPRGRKVEGIKRALTTVAANMTSTGGGGELDVAEATVRGLERRGKQYGLGWYRGRDGQDHLGIDEEELEADYHHGQDWSKGRLGREDISRWQEY